MNKTRLFEGLAVVVSTAALSVSAPALGQSETCGPSAHIFGEVPRAGELGEKLRQRGIDIAPPDDCDAAQVFLVVDGSRYRVAVIDASGWGVQRVVQTLDVAAALAESWIRSDLDEPLAGPGPQPMPVPPSPVPPLALIPKTAVAVQAPPVATQSEAPPRLRFVLNTEIATGNETGIDGPLTYGLRLSSCVLVGGVCVGLTGRLAEVNGSSGSLSPQTEVLMQLGWPIRWTRAELMPFASMGVGWGRMQPDAMVGCSTPGGGSLTQACAFATYYSDQTALDFRVESGAQLNLFLGRYFALTGRISVAVTHLGSNSSGPGVEGRVGLGVEWSAL